MLWWMVIAAHRWSMYFPIFPVLSASNSSSKVLRYSFPSFGLDLSRANAPCVVYVPATTFFFSLLSLSLKPWGACTYNCKLLCKYFTLYEASTRGEVSLFFLTCSRTRNSLRRLYLLVLSPFIPV